MSPIVDRILTIIGSVLISSGFWGFIVARINKRDETLRAAEVKRANERKLLLGLAHDRIMSLGMEYIKRGWLTKDEYENLNDYLYSPYKAEGGNGSAKRIMDLVGSLPIRKA